MKQIDWEEERINNVLIIGKTKTIELKDNQTKSIATRIKEQGIANLRKNKKVAADPKAQEKYIAFYEKIKDSVRKLCLFTTQLSYSIILEQKNKNTEILFLSNNPTNSQLQEIWNEVYKKENYQFILYYKGERLEDCQYIDIIQLIADLISYEKSEQLEKKLVKER